MRDKFAHKRPRFHPGLEWEGRNLTNEFVDINRMAFDNRYGKNAAPLSKRRTGIGFTDGSTPGLFGIGGRSRTIHVQNSKGGWTPVRVGPGDARYRGPDRIYRPSVKVKPPKSAWQRLWSPRGMGGIKELAQDPRSAYFLGGIVAVGAYTALDYFTYKKGQSQLRRMINRTPSSLLVGAVAFSLFAPSS